MVSSPIGGILLPGVEMLDTLCARNNRSQAALNDIKRPTTSIVLPTDAMLLPAL